MTCVQGCSGGYCNGRYSGKFTQKDLNNLSINQIQALPGGCAIYTPTNGQNPEAICRAI